MSLTPDEHHRLAEFGAFLQARDPAFARRLDLVAAQRRRRVRARLGRLAALAAVLLLIGGAWLIGAGSGVGMALILVGVGFLTIGGGLILRNEARGIRRG